MEILHPNFSPDADLPERLTDLSRLLMLTDRPGYAAAAESAGISCVSIHPGEMKLDWDDLLAGVETLIVAYGSGISPSYDEVLMYAQNSALLLRAAVAAKQVAHLILLEEDDDVFTSVLDGMSLSVAAEEQLMTSVVRVDGTIDSKRLVMWIASAVHRPGYHLQSIGHAINRVQLKSIRLSTEYDAVRSGDVVVLVGGSGGIGRKVCRHLAQRGARVVVIGRSKPDPYIAGALRDAGSSIYLRIDQDQSDAIDQALRYVHAHVGPISIVINLAGVLRDALIWDIGDEEIDAVFRPKAGVALALASIRGAHRPARVVHFGSLTAVTGNVGQSAYGGANAFIRRLSEITPGWQCIEWGLWDTNGMQMPDEDTNLRAMDPDDASEMLLTAIASEERRLVIYDGELSFPPKDTSVVMSGAEASSQKIVSAVRNWVRTVITRHTGLERVDDDDNLLDHGVDSVASVRISRDIESRIDPDGTGRLSRALVLQYPTIAMLVNYLVETAWSQLTEHLVPALPITSEDSSTSQTENPVIVADPAESSDVVVGANATYRSDDIAIIGMAGEFPNADNVSEFWQTLLRGEDGVTEIPKERWDWKDEYAAAIRDDQPVPGRHGGFLRHAYEFDPMFFGIAPAEADRLDPQERRFLQTAYHAWEDGGCFSTEARNTGVFVAAMFDHYQDLAADRPVDGSFAAIANRVSYMLDLHGPSIAVDTMCSGGLTAVHLAATAIRSGDCDMAIAGGVNIMPHPGKYRLLTEKKFLSPTGACHAFGIAADGYVPGEGVGAIVLKRLSAAQRDDDRIHAVIRASAINAGGRTSGFTVPSEEAQQHVITSALQRAEVTPSEVTYVEAHGTGTELGDPIEVRALENAYGGKSKRAYLGTVKSNIGHLESAAALAGLIKVVCQLSSRTLVPTLHCNIINPELDLESSRFDLVREVTPWEADSNSTRLAGLSSFGAGGSNGHLILQEYEEPLQEVPIARWHFIPLSGRDETALQRRTDELVEYLNDNPDVALYGVSWTLSCARQHLRTRRGVWVRDVAELQAILNGAPESEPDPSEVGPSWFDRVKEWQQGSAVHFRDLFPVRHLVDLPLYPFRNERYLAPCFDRRTSTLESSLDSLPLTCQWQDSPVGEGGQPPGMVLVLLDENADLPEGLSAIDALVVRPADLTETSTLNALVERAGGNDLVCIDLRREWTTVQLLAFAGFIWHRDVRATILSACCLEDHAEVRAMPGFFMGFAEENPGVRSIRLQYDIWPGWSALLAEVTGDSDADDVRLIAGRRQIRVLSELAMNDRHRLRPRGRYLVTGGLGEVGRAIVEHLCTELDAEVVVVGRSIPDEEGQQWLTEFGVHFERADLSNANDTRSLVERVLERYGPITGVVHSAGVIRDGLIHDKTSQDAEAVLAPKVAGLRNLDAATSDLPLELFCVFGSISGVLGNVGQSDYIAANRFVDEFALDRARQVKKGMRSGFTLSIDWPLWFTERSAVDRATLGGYLRDTIGLEPLTHQRGGALFQELIDTVPDSCHQVIACVGDRTRISQVLLPTSEVSQSPIEAVEVPALDSDRGTEVLLNGDVLNGDAGEAAVLSATQVLDRLLELVQDSTGIDVSEIDPDDSWGDLGFTSVMLQQFATKASEDFAVDVPPNALFRYRSPMLLAEYLGVSEPVSIRTTGSTDKERSERSAYAIVGMSGAMPGGDGLDDFWRLLIENRDAIGPVERWSGKNSDLRAGTINSFDHFDNAFFGISGREAVAMDPQHRIFLQAAYNALVAAGQAPSLLREVGVFAAVQFAEYQALLGDTAERTHTYAVTGNAHAMLANRVSHLFNLNGPSQTIDTACSSALVALNRAVMSLENQECELAVVGAVSVMVNPETTRGATSLGVLSPQHRCATFDKDADGYVRGEGVGCLVLKRLEDAEEALDPIFAVVERVVENHDGRANSLTAPNPDAQVELLTKAYRDDLAERVSFIETHGTGTVLGDPIEIQALQTALADRAPGRAAGSVAVGAVKTNIGHLEPAAGMAGLIKTVMCLQHRKLPANLHLRELNPLINLDGSPLRLLTHNEEWRGPAPLVAGVSSFGFGGSNAHVVLSEAPRPSVADHPARPSRLVVLSARSRYSLERMRDELLAWLRTDANDLGDISYTLAAGRDHFEYRLAWGVQDREDLIAQMESAQPEDVPRCDRSDLNSRLAEVSNRSTDPVESYSSKEYDLLVQEERERFLAGAQLDIAALFGDGRYRRLSMPGYVFKPTRFWI